MTQTAVPLSPANDRASWRIEVEFALTVLSWSSYNNILGFTLTALPSKS